MKSLRIGRFFGYDSNFVCLVDLFKNIGFVWFSDFTEVIFLQMAIFQNIVMQMPQNPFYDRVTCVEAIALELYLHIL